MKPIINTITSGPYAGYQLYENGKGILYAADPTLENIVPISKDYASGIKILNRTKNGKPVKGAMLTGYAGAIKESTKEELLVEIEWTNNEPSVARVTPVAYNLLQESLYSGGYTSEQIKQELAEKRAAELEKNKRDAKQAKVVLTAGAILIVLMILFIVLFARP